MKYSMMLTTVRNFDKIKPLLQSGRPDIELIIIDPRYNQETKKQLEQADYNFSQIIYAPKFKDENKLDELSVYKYKNDKLRCHNTGFAYCEGEWIFKLDDDTELCPDFFKLLDEDLKIGINQYNKDFVIRPVKLEGWMGHKKWDDLPILEHKQGNFFELRRHGYFETLDQFIASYESITMLNGVDERYDIGHGHDDLDILNRYITLGYKIILDKRLKTYQQGHKRKIDPIPFCRWLFDMEEIEIKNGRYKVYNPYTIEQLRQELLPNKNKYKIEKKGTTINEKNPKWYLEDKNPFDKYFTEEEIQKNRKQILSLKDKHKDEDLFILGNSPDITKDFIDKIRDKTTFAANGFLVMKDKWNYEPTYTVITNQGTFDNHLRNMIPEFKEYEGSSVSELFMTAKKTIFILSELVLKPVYLSDLVTAGKIEGFIPYILRRNERINFLKNHIHIKILNKSEYEYPYEITDEIPKPEDISFNLLKGTYLVGTVITDLMLPLAVWMGFKNIYLKGCSGGAGHFYDISPRHFWDEKKQNHMYHHVYAVFKKLLNEKNINIYNLDKPEPDEIINEKISQLSENPTKHDGHLWDGPTMHNVLGIEPNIIPYKNLDEIL